jgi:hypothetical protein
LSDAEKREEPKKGEAWRHCKGDLYMVVGFSIDPDGELNVLYQNAHLRHGELFNQKISRWMEVYEPLGKYRFERADDLKGG